MRGVRLRGLVGRVDGANADLGGDLSRLADASAENAESPEPIGPFLAVPNLVGWPDLVMLPDGTFLATLYNRPNHATAEGAMDLWASVDGGVKWESNRNCLAKK
jgi:hypothetical protein